MEKIKIRIDVDVEQIPIRGNISATDDHAADKALEDETIERLERGDVWAWCCVTIEARYGRFVGRTHLGGCSYKDLDDFKASGYYADMVEEAIESMKEDMLAAVKVGEEAKLARILVENAYREVQS